MPLELFDFQSLVDGHLEREPALASETSQRERAASHIGDQLVRSAGAFDQARRLFDPLLAAAGERQVREPLAQRGLGFVAHEHRPFGMAAGTAEDEPDVLLRLPDDARVRHMLRPELQHRATALANRRFDQRHATPADHAGVQHARDVGHVPDEHAHRPARGHVYGDREPDGGDRDRQHELELLAAPRTQPLAVTPGRELEAPGLADPDQVVGLPANESDLLRGCGDAALAGRAGQRLDALQPVVERGEIPAGALRADHPEAALPLVERKSPSDAEP